MTMLNDTSNSFAIPTAIRGAIRVFLTRLANLINDWVAAVIAHREHHANLVVLRSLSDRELRDIGLARGQIGEGLAEASNVCSDMQLRQPREKLSILGKG